MTALKDNNAKGIRWLISALAVLYIGISSVSILSDPLVLAPQLDARENLLWAGRIATGILPVEPFYRALLYPFLLSLVGPETLRPLAGAALGLVCHLANGLLVGVLAVRFWRSRNTALTACILYLVNPASLFFALQLLDITFAITLFLGAIVLAMDPRRAVWKPAGSGALAALAILARPHFLPVALVLPLVAAFSTSHRSWRPLLAYGPLLILLAGQGLLNLQQSGTFRILPWQGAYNLWAANKPEANGLYFKQSVDLALRGNNENPTRAESIYLYGIAHPDEQPPYNISSMNNFWRGKFVSHVVENPLQVGRLWLHKAYAVANSFEQYNNLTFSFHKARIPSLEYNPLNWGILLVFGTLGLCQLCRNQPRTALAVLILMLAYGSTLILFFASARFRLPLVPLMAIFAAGSIGWFRHLWVDRGRLLATVSIVFTTSMLAFGSFGGIRNTDTYIQDRLLMANANAELGEDAKAAKWAREVLQASPDRQEAQRIYAISYFNLQLAGEESAAPWGSWLDQRDWVRPTATTDAAYASILAYYKWHWGDKETARKIWEQVFKANPDDPALAGLTLSVLNSNPALLTQNQLIIRRMLGDE